MYKLTRTKGSFPGGIRTMTFTSYDALRQFLRRYYRRFTGWSSQEHPPMFLITTRLPILIKKSA